MEDYYKGTAMLQSGLVLSPVTHAPGGGTSDIGRLPVRDHSAIAKLWQAYLDARQPGALGPADINRMLKIMEALS